jgi:uncharacterized protein (TIGR03067 family)
MRRAVEFVLLLLTGTPVVAAPAPLPKPERNSQAELLNLQGEWYWERPEGGAVRVVIGDGLVRWRAGTEFELTETFRVFPAKAPKAIDTTRRDLGTTPGIYSLQGDTLVIRQTVKGDRRPTSFDGETDDESTLILRRAR